MNKYESRYLLSLGLSSSRHRPVVLTSGHATPIYDIRVQRRRMSLGIFRIRSEALPKHGNHLRQPVYFQLSTSSASYSFTGEKRETSDRNKKIGLTRIRSAR